MLVEIFIADIVSAEAIKGAKKLLKLQGRLGEGEERQVDAGETRRHAGRTGGGLPRGGPAERDGKRAVVAALLRSPRLRARSGRSTGARSSRGARSQDGSAP